MSPRLTSETEGRGGASPLTRLVEEFWRRDWFEMSPVARAYAKNDMKGALGRAGLALTPTSGIAVAAATGTEGSGPEGKSPAEAVGDAPKVPSPLSNRTEEER